MQTYLHKRNFIKDKWFFGVETSIKQRHTYVDFISLFDRRLKSEDSKIGKYNSN